MLSKEKWLWCAEHHELIRTLVGASVSICFAVYFSIFLNRFWWTNKIPIQYKPAISQMEKLGCNDYEVGEMFIPSKNKIAALNGNFENYVREPLERGDARLLLLENYYTKVLGSEILDRRPECLGAYIADKQNWPEPFAILVVDRNSGKTIFRIARLRDYLKR